MNEAVKTKTFDGRHKNHRIRLTYNLNKNVVRIICAKPELGSEYLSKLILEKKIGLVDSVIYSAKQDSVVVALLRGIGLDKFLRAGTKKPQSKKAVSAKKSFSDMANDKETGS